MTDALRPRDIEILLPGAHDGVLRPIDDLYAAAPAVAAPPVDRVVRVITTIHEDYALAGGQLYPITPPHSQRLGPPVSAAGLFPALGAMPSAPLLYPPASGGRRGDGWVVLLGLALGLGLLGYLLWPSLLPLASLLPTPPLAPADAPPAPPSAPLGEVAPLGVLEGPPSISVAQIDAVLAEYGSPATGQGQAFYDIGVEYGIDPAYALAFFIHESSAGANPAWAGLKGDGTTTHNVGNIICAGYSRCYGRFRDYGSWEEGIADWYRLIQVEYIQGRGHRTVADVLPVYAPSADNNNPAGYTSAVEALVAEWRAAAPVPAGAAAPLTFPAPAPVPLVGGRVELWPGAAPCAGWHDGAKDFCAPEGTPVAVPVTLRYSGTGFYSDARRYGHYWIGNAADGCEVYLGHLKDPVAFAVGATVPAGTIIGYLGPFAYSEPHTHVQLRCNGALLSESAWDAWWAAAIP